MVITRQKPKKSNGVLRPYDHLPSKDLNARARSRGLFFKPPLQEFVIKHAIHADYVSEESLPRHIFLQTSCEVDACYQRPHHHGPQFGNRMTECLLPCRDKQITKRTTPRGSRGAISQTQIRRPAPPGRHNSCWILGKVVYRIRSHHFPVNHRLVDSSETVKSARRGVGIYFKSYTVVHLDIFIS